MPIELFGISIGRAKKEALTSPTPVDKKVQSFVLPDLDDAMPVDAGGYYGIGIDLDEAGSAATNYMVVNRIYPQADTTNTQDTTLTFQFGASDIPRATPVYGTATTFDIATDHKIDSRAAGRYLSYKLTITDNKDFELSGFDLDVIPTGRR